MLTNSLKILDSTKTESLELKLFRSDQKILQSYCCAELISVSDSATC